MAEPFTIIACNVCGAIFYGDRPAADEHVTTHHGKYQAEPHLRLVVDNARRDSTSNTGGEV